jgi:hypothetical protein
VRQPIEVRKVDGLATGTTFKCAATGGRNDFPFAGSVCKRTQQFVAYLTIRAGYQNAHLNVSISSSRRRPGPMRSNPPVNGFRPAPE